MNKFGISGHKTAADSRSGLYGLIVAFAIVAALTSILHARVALSGGTPPKRPLTVSAVTFKTQESYRRPVSYLGLVVAGRRANLGFEIPGTVTTPPLRPGSQVAAGQVIAALDRSALESKRNATAADLEQARVELELAQLKARRQKELQSTGAVSKEAFDDTRLTARALRSRVEAVNARLSSIDIELEKSQLIAPYDGIVADRYVHQGAVVNPGMPVVRLLESGALEAHVGVSASRAGALVVGEKHVLKLRNTSFEAQLISVRPDVDPLTRATTTVFALPVDIEMLDGEPVTLELEETIGQSGGWLPISSLQEGKRGIWTVLRIKTDGEYHSTVREAVEVLEIRGNQAYVRGTLAHGSLVVADGVHRVGPGVQVAIGNTQ